jgi:hypothetical protein
MFFLGRSSKPLPRRTLARRGLILGNIEPEVKTTSGSPNCKFLVKLWYFH